MADAAPQALPLKEKLPLQQRLRPPLRHRILHAPLSYMLLLSLFLHLSMVTVFKVMVYFPYNEAQVYAFHLVPDLPRPETAMAEVSPPPAAAPSGRLGTLKITGLQDLEEGERPEVALPTIEFAEFERLRLAQSGLKAPSLYESLYANEPTDSWARLVRRSHRLGESILELATGESDLEDLDGPQVEKPMIARIGQGYVAEVVWDSGFTRRKILFAPPIPALQQLDPSGMSQPIAMVLRVNAQGKVTNSYSPQLEPAEVIDAIQAATQKYQFEPLPLNTKEEFALVRLYIRPAREDELG